MSCLLLIITLRFTFCEEEKTKLVKQQKVSKHDYDCRFCAIVDCCKVVVEFEFVTYYMWVVFYSV